MHGPVELLIFILVTPWAMAQCKKDMESFEAFQRWDSIKRRRSNKICIPDAEKFYKGQLTQDTLASFY